jgi:hypothetical protein
LEWAQNAILRYPHKDYFAYPSNRDAIPRYLYEDYFAYPSDRGYYFSSARNYAGLDYELEVILLDLF